MQVFQQFTCTNFGDDQVRGFEVAEGHGDQNVELSYLPVKWFVCHAFEPENLSKLTHKMVELAVVKLFTNLKSLFTGCTDIKCSAKCRKWGSYGGNWTTR